MEVKQDTLNLIDVIAKGECVLQQGTCYLSYSRFVGSLIASLHT